MSRNYRDEIPDGRMRCGACRVIKTFIRRHPREETINRAMKDITGVLKEFEKRTTNGKPYFDTAHAQIKKIVDRETYNLVDKHERL